MSVMIPNLHTHRPAFSERVKPEACEYQIIDRKIAEDDYDSHECGRKADSRCAQCGPLCKKHREEGDCFGKTHEMIGSQ